MVVVVVGVVGGAVSVELLSGALGAAVSVDGAATGADVSPEVDAGAEGASELVDAAGALESLDESLDVAFATPAKAGSATSATSAGTAMDRTSFTVFSLRKMVGSVSNVPPVGRIEKTQFHDWIRLRPPSTRQWPLRALQAPPARPLQLQAMRIPLDQQRATYRQHADAAAQHLRELLEERIDTLVQLGYERAFSTVGVHEYGDSTYWKRPDSLVEEAAAELADAIFYLHIPIARAAGDLPPLDPDVVS